MPVIKGDRFIADPYTAVTDEEEIPAGCRPIVSLARFLKERESLLARAAPLGIRLKSNDNPGTLKDVLPNIALVAIEFPNFRDGRGFSWARMLRARFNFKGEIRAVGDFLYDQLAFMVRTGFDAFEVRQDFREEDFSRAMREITFFYQPSVDGKKTIRDLRASR